MLSAHGGGCSVVILACALPLTLNSRAENADVPSEKYLFPVMKTHASCASGVDVGSEVAWDKFADFSSRTTLLLAKQFLSVRGLWRRASVLFLQLVLVG